jgi:transcriptional regulator
MSNNYDDIVADLRNNLKRIINLYESQKEKNRVLTKKNEELNSILSLIKKEDEELKLKYNNIELAKAINESSGTNHDARIKVNRIVREIDKCIALLNK